MAETYYVKPENSPVNDLTLNSGDAMFITNGGTANGAVVNSDGSATVNDGGSANNTTVNEGGTLHALGGTATGVNVASNGRLEVNKGATATGIAAAKGATLVFDVAADTHIAGTSDGAAFQIQNGIATGFVLETGVLIVSEGGKAVETTLNSAGFINVSQGGSADKAVINTSGELKVSSGGTATEATVKTGGKLTVESGGFCDDATIEMGGNLYVVSSGGTAAGTYIGAMGNLAVSKGGTAYGTTVGAGGFLTVGTKGIAEGADVNGFLNVLEGGLASNVTVNEGAVVYVQSKGTGSDVSVDYGGILEVLADGRLKGATVSQGGSATIHAGVMASNVVIDGGKVTVMSDGWAAQTGVSGNTIVENGGLLEVEGGAHVEGAYVSAGGHVDVLSDGSFASALITNADVSAYKGAFVSRMNLEQGGVLRIESGASAQHLNVSAGGVLTGILREASELKFYGGTLDLNIAGVSPESEALVDNISFTAIMPVAEDYLCTLTVSDTQAEGAYTLIEDATVFDKTITVKDTSGTTLGTLTVVEGTKTIGETKYTLAITRRHDELNDKDFDDLTVTIGASDITPPVDLTGNLTSKYDLEAGKYASSVNILDGGKLNVYKDALASQTAVNSGGSMVVSQGGSASDTTVNNGGKLYVSQGGIASKTELNDGGKLFASGSVGGATVSLGGSMFVSSGATVNDINVSAGGFLWIYDGVTATGIVAAKGAELYFYVAPDTYVKGTYAESDFEMKDATLSDFTAWKKCTVAVRSGGVTSNTTLNDGTLQVDGGVAKDTVVKINGEIWLYGKGSVVSGVTFQDGCHLWIRKSGGKLTGKVTFETGAGVTYSDGASATLDFDLTQTTAGADALVNDLSPVLAAPFDYTLTVDGTEADGNYKLAEGATGFDKTITVVNTSGDTLDTLTVGEIEKLIGGQKYTLTLNGAGSLGVTLGDYTPAVDLTGDLDSAFDLTAGMYGSSVNILDGGNLEVFEGGFTSQTTVNSGGDLSVSAGGSANVVTVNFGGDLFVRNGGIATLVKENGGYASVNDGATVTFVPNSFGGYNYNKADDWCTIHSGTTGTDLTVGNSGTIMVYSSGLAKNTTINKDGKLHVSSGGIARDTTVNDGGRLYVSSGGIARDTTVNDGGLIEGSGCEIDGIVVNSGGSLLLYSGAKLTGQMTFASGAEVIPFVGSILDFDLTQTEPGSPALVNDLSILMGTPTYTLTVGASQAEGTYSLAGGATGFDKTITVKDTLGAELGTLTVAEGTKTIGETKYTLSLTGSNLSVTVGDTSVIDNTPPTITITPSTTESATSVTLTAVFDDDVAVATKEYMIDSEGVWKSYTGPVTVTENVYVSFRATDTSENGTVQGYNVTNIETSTPVNGPAEPKNNTLLIDKTHVNTDVTEAVGTTLTAAGQEILFDQTGAVDENGYHNSVDKDDAIDYAKIVLKNGAKLSFHAEATAAATFTVYSLTEKNNKYTLKKLQTLKLTDKDKNGVFTADSSKLLSLSASGAYYVSMQFTDKDKSKTAYYNVTLNGEDSKTPSEFYPLGNNTDDWTNMKTVGYGSGAEIDDLGEIKDGTPYLISGEWAGFGDKVDCKKFTLNSAAELSLSVSAQDGPLKLSVCRLKATTSKKNGKTTTTYSQVTIKSVTVKAGQPKPLNSLRLAAGDYFFKAESTDVKKSTGYSVQITDGEFYTDGDGGWNNVLLDGKKLNENADHFYNNTLSTAGSIYLDKAGNDMNSSVAAEYGEEKYGGFVGFGDETDFAKLSLTETSDVKFTLEATNDATLEIFKVTEKDGKYSKKSVQTVKYKSGGEAVSSKKPVTLEVKDGVSYYVSVKATNIKKTTADPRTYYNVSYAVVPKDASSLSMPETDALASSLSVPDTLSLGQYDTDVLAGTSFDSASDKLLAESGAGLLASL